MISSMVFPMIRAVVSPLPSYLIFFVTARCNSRCKTCFYWQHLDRPKPDELSLDEIRKIAKRCGFVAYLTISGGEPTLRDDLPEIVGAFHEHAGLQVVSIPTNGSRPKVAEEMARTILRKCPGLQVRFALSMDGIGEAHDVIRGVPGSFESVLESHRALVEVRSEFPDFMLDVTTVMSRYNEDRIETVFDWVAETLEIDNHVLVLTRGKPREPAAGEVNIERYARAAAHVEALAKARKSHGRNLRRAGLKAIKLTMRDVIVKSTRENRMIVPCVAGRRMAVISETGEVFPCELLETPMGSLREVDYEMARIVSSPEAVSIRRSIRDHQCHCTFECAIQNSLVYHPPAYARIFGKFLR